jgi:MFS family permease
VAALLTMGLSTVAIGLLPTYGAIGIAAPALLALCRLGQGLGLGGEWGGAVLLATENAPRGKESLYGMFPQFGSPLGFWCATGIFIGLSSTLTEAQFLAWGWRLPFIASAVLVFVGLYIRLQLTETPAFQRTIEQQERVRIPIATLFREHPRTLVLATLAAIVTYVIFYLMTVFTLSWGTGEIGFARQHFLLLLMIGVIFFALTFPNSALGADRIGRWRMLMVASVLVFVFGLLFEPLFASGSSVKVTVFLSIGLGLMGMTYGALGTALAELFPTAVRYTGASVAFNFAGILGGSLAPYIATSLAANFGIASVGYYLSGAALVTLAAQLLLRRPAEGTSSAARSAPPPRARAAP